jgi:tetratricopeptide (TPR) repeat protein
MAQWKAFAPPLQLTPDEVRTLWPRLHSGDTEPCPEDAALLHAWTLFHRGEFEAAVSQGLSLTAQGLHSAWTVVNRATTVYANYVEPLESQRLALLHQAAEQAQAHVELQPHNANAWYLLALSLGRYAQGISVAKALAQGIGARVRDALEKTIALNPAHSDAKFALATFHAEVIDKVGELIANMTYGAKKDRGLALYAEAHAQNPASLVGMLEMARGLVMLEGEAQQARALGLYQQVSCSVATDAFDHLVIALAHATLRDL